MEDVALDLDPAMIDNMRREAENHGFDDLDGYVQWLLERRDLILNEADVWNNPPGVADPDADLSQSSGSSLTIDESLAPESDAESGTAGADADPEGDDDAELPDEDGADDDDVAAALEEIELDDDEE